MEIRRLWFNASPVREIPSQPIKIGYYSVPPGTQHAMGISVLAE
jgi:hypothetical protein